MPQFYFPRTIVQYAEYPDTNISWSNNQVDSTIIENPDYNFAAPAPGAGSKNVLQTVKHLTHIPNPTRGPRLDKTYYLKCTNFGIDLASLPTNITGLELTIDAQRYGRVVDDTVCLIYNGEVISENKTNLADPIEGHLRNSNTQIYGKIDDLWGAEITPEMLTSENFGVLLRFASNPLYPHKDTIEVFRITLKIYPYESFIFEDNTESFITEENDLVFVPE